MGGDAAFGRGYRGVLMLVESCRPGTLPKLAVGSWNAVRSKSPEQLRVFVNAALGETWKEDTTTVDESGLLPRRDLRPLVPERVSRDHRRRGCSGRSDRGRGDRMGPRRGVVADRIRRHPGPDRKPIFVPWQDLDMVFRCASPRTRRDARHRPSGSRARRPRCYDEGIGLCKPREERRIWALKGGEQDGDPCCGPSAGTRITPGMSLCGSSGRTPSSGRSCRA